MAEAYVWPELKPRNDEPQPAPESVREQAREEGHRQGFEEGLAEGRQAAEAEVVGMRQQLQQGLARLEAELERREAEQLQALAATAHALCRKVLGVEITTQPEIFEQVLNEGLSRLDAGAEGAEVHLNPDDLAAFLPDYHGALPLHADAQVPRCGMSIRARDRAVDFDPLTMIDELFDAVRHDVGG